MEKKLNNNRKIIFWEHLLENNLVIFTSCGGDEECFRCHLEKDGKKILFCKTPFSLTGEEKFSIYWQKIKYPQLEENIFLDAGTTFWKLYNFKGKQIAIIPSPFLILGSDVIQIQKNKGLFQKENKLLKKLEKKLINIFNHPFKNFISGNPTILETFSLFQKSLPLNLLPTLSPLIGSDALIMAEALFPGEMGIDAGTNCELCFRISESEYLFASSPTGPAFEGGGIKNGVPAIKGAITRWEKKNGRILIETIDNQLPIGITSSGIINIINFLLQEGKLKKDGYFPEKNLVLFQYNEKKIILTQNDIREIQKGIAALKAAIVLLTKKAGIKPTKIKVIGNFLSSLEEKTLKDTGILPDNIKVEKSNPIPSLISQHQEKIPQKLKEIKTNSHLLPLSGNPHFEDLFFKLMTFEIYSL